MAKNVAPDNVNIDVGLQHLLAFNWIYGFVLSIATYWPLKYFLAIAGHRTQRYCMVLWPSLIALIRIARSRLIILEM